MRDRRRRRRRPACKVNTDSCPGSTTSLNSASSKSAQLTSPARAVDQARAGGASRGWRTGVQFQHRWAAMGQPRSCVVAAMSDATLRRFVPCVVVVFWCVLKAAPPRRGPAPSRRRRRRLAAFVEADDASRCSPTPPPPAAAAARHARARRPGVVRRSLLERR